jgi:hypothetical protein
MRLRSFIISGSAIGGRSFTYSIRPVALISFHIAWLERFSTIVSGPMPALCKAKKCSHITHMLRFFAFASLVLNPDPYC